MFGVRAAAVLLEVVCCSVVGCARARRGCDRLDGARGTPRAVCPQQLMSVAGSNRYIGVLFISEVGDHLREYLHRKLLRSLAVSTQV